MLNLREFQGSQHDSLLRLSITRGLYTLKPLPTIPSFAIARQMFGGSSLLPTTVEHCFVVCTVLDDLITAHLAVFESRVPLAKTHFVG